MKTAIPFDILAQITDILDAKSDKETLRTLSRTCRFMVPLCRRYLFSSVRLSNSPTPKDLGLIRFLSGSPNTTFCVKNLVYTVETATPTYQHIIDAMFEVIRSHSTSLQSITLLFLRRPDWNVLREPTKSLLISLIQLPTITHFNLESARHFPFVALSLCSGLTDISISNVSDADLPFDADQIITRSKIPAPVSLYFRGFHSVISVLMRPSGPNAVVRDPIIDFSCLKKATFDICDAREASQMLQLLKMATQLQILFIELDILLELTGLGSSLAANAYQTLKSLDLHLNVAGENYDPLCGLTFELRQLSGNNILEKLCVIVSIGVDEPCRTDSDNWSNLDAILTDRGAFPMLCRVAIQLAWYSCERDEEEVGHLLGNLTEDQFPRLRESSKIQFRFDEEHQFI